MSIAKLISWDMRFGLPNQRYLEFVSRYLLHGETEDPVDPFAVEIPENKITDIYLEREEVVKEINLPGTRVIVGAPGSGKTTLFRIMSSSSHDRVLIVRLSIRQMGVSSSEQELMDGKISLLTPQNLAPYIFNAYWNSVLRNFAEREKFLKIWRKDRIWMDELRWFYQQYPPVVPEIEGEFELMAWLRTPISMDLLYFGSSPEEKLKALVKYCVSEGPSFQRYGRYLRRPFSSVQVLIDGTEQLSGKAIRKLVQDAEKLYGLALEGMQLKLFVDTTWLGMIEEMDCVRQGRVVIYKLPPWSMDELNLMLDRRVDAWRSGEFLEFNQAGQNLRWMSDASMLLEPTARNLFIQTIIQNARRVYQPGWESEELDAPVHALRLARGLVAACAGCWESYGYCTPLSLENVQKLGNYYWAWREEN